MFKGNKNGDKLRLMIALGVFGAVGLTAALYGFVSYQQGNALGSLAAAGIALVVVMLFVVFFRSSYRGVMSGFPIKDERTKGIETKAAAFTYFVSIYVWLGILFFAESISTYRAAELAIIVSALVFGASYFWFERRSRQGKV